MLWGLLWSVWLCFWTLDWIANRIFVACSQRTGSAICNLPFRCDVILKTAPPLTERSTAFGSARLDLTRLSSFRFVVSFVRGLLVLSTRFVPLRCVSLDRLLVRSFVRFLSVRVDSIIIETNLNFYEYERALRVGGSAEGEGIM